MPSEEKKVTSSPEEMQEPAKKTEVMPPPFKQSEECTFDIERHTIPLMQDSPFFAMISRNIGKICSRAIPTAAIAYDCGRDEINFYYNDLWFSTLTNGEVRGILRHEFYHFVFGHLAARRRRPPKMWNIATDLAINSIIILNAGKKTLSPSDAERPLPTCVLVPGQWPIIDGKEPTDEQKAAMPVADLIAKMPHNKASEWYFNELSKFAQEHPELCSRMMIGDEGDGEPQPGTGDPSDSFDDHSGWDKIPEEKREFAEQRAKGILEKAVREADQNQNGWGDIPQELREAIRRSVSSIIDWRAILRQFIGSICRGQRTTSIKRINKRYPYIHPGTKRAYVAKLCIAMDQSSSVTDPMVMLFFAELASLTKKVDVTILPFDADCSIKDAYEWKRGGRVDLKRVKCGGTDFNAPTRVVNDPKYRGRWDGMLILTDGECSKPVSSRTKRGWVLAPEHKLLFETDEMQISLNDGQPMKGAWR